MAFLEINGSAVTADRWYRTNQTGSWSGLTSSAYVSESIGFVYDRVDYPMYTISASFYYAGTTFEATIPDYDVMPDVISMQPNVSFASFVPRRDIALSASVQDMNEMTSFFVATSPDYIGLTASLDTLETIELGAVANVDPDQPEFPSPPPVGDADLNRFRKTYTHVRVRPRIRKYSTSP